MNKSQQGNFSNQLLEEFFRSSQTSSVSNCFDVKVFLKSKTCLDENIFALSLDPERKLFKVSYQAKGCFISKTTSSILSFLIDATNFELANNLAICIKKDFSVAGSKTIVNNPVIAKANISQDKKDAVVALYTFKSFPLRANCVLLAVNSLIACIDGLRKQQVLNP
jgi:NifU-like protein involved in Fe-S cluster formation